MSCQETSGFLFAHGCDQPAMGACGSCGKQICLLHTRLLPEGTMCVGCARQRPPSYSTDEKSKQDPDDPFLYQPADGYDPYAFDDYAAFDPKKAAKASLLREEDLEHDRFGT